MTDNYTLLVFDENGRRTALFERARAPHTTGSHLSVEHMVMAAMRNCVPFGHVLIRHRRKNTRTVLLGCAFRYDD